MLNLHFQISPALEHSGNWIPEEHKKTHNNQSLMTFHLNKTENKIKGSFLELFHHCFESTYIFQ